MQVVIPSGASTAPIVTTAATALLAAEVVLGTGIIMSGLAASRPAFGTAGRIYFSTDTRVLERDTGSAWEILANGPITRGTETVTTSGATVDITGIPANVQRIIVLLEGVSTNGTSLVILQIGDAGGVEVAAYAGTVGSTNSGVTEQNYSAGFTVDGGTLAATVTRTAMIILQLKDASDFTWIESHTSGEIGTLGVSWGAGSKALSAVLDRIRLTTVNGTDTFDAGSMTVIYE